MSVNFSTSGVQGRVVNEEQVKRITQEGSGGSTVAY
jgi:hypothetical protein